MPTPQPLTLKQLGDFLKHPARAFLQQRLGVSFREDDPVAQDEEPFGLDGLEHWKLQGYTHVIVYGRGLSFVTENPSSKIVAEGRDALYETLERLQPVEQTADGVYSVYRIP